MNDYLYDVDEAQYSFVRVPKLLLQHDAYQRISSEAKLLYSLLLDRVGLSHKKRLEGQAESHLYHLSDRAAKDEICVKRCMGNPRQAAGGDSSESPPAVFWLQKTLLANQIEP